MHVAAHDMHVLLVMTCCVRELTFQKLRREGDLEKAASPPCHISTCCQQRYVQKRNMGQVSTANLR